MRVSEKYSDLPESKVTDKEIARSSEYKYISLLQLGISMCLLVVVVVAAVVTETQPRAARTKARNREAQL